MGWADWPVSLIARGVLKNAWAAVLFVFLYLNYYPLQLANLFDFHAVTFATTSLLFAFYFLALHPFKRRIWNYGLGSLFVLVTLLAKENAALVCLSFFILIVFHVIPFHRSAASFALAYFDLRNPFALIMRLFSDDSYLYIKNLLAPFGFIPLLSPLTLLIALPELLINLLSSNSNMRQLHFHYTSMLTPFLIISAIYGFKKISTYVFNSTKLLRGVVALLLLASITGNIFGGTVSYPIGKIDKDALREVNTWRVRLKEPNIRVSASGTVAPFFTERRSFYYFLFDPAYKNMGKTDADIMKQIDNYKHADYIIIRESDVASSDPLIMAYYNKLIEDTDYKKISDRHGIEVYRNISRL